MKRSNAERFISRFNSYKFERKNRISKIYAISIKSLLYVGLVILCLAPAFLSAQTETTVAGDLIYARAGSGLNAVLMPRPQDNNTEIIFYLQAGTMYESDSLNGVTSLLNKILSDKIANAIKNDKSGLNQQNTAFSSYSNTEQTVFKFVTTSQNMQTCFQLFRDSVLLSNISMAEVARARNTTLQQIEDAKHDLGKIFEDKLYKGLYVQDHYLFEILGNPTRLKTFDRNLVLAAFKKYYAVNNTVIAITGNFSALSAEASMDVVFKDVLKNEFNPETITKIVDLRPMTYNTQFVIEDTINNPEFQMCWQFPGTNNNLHESYCAFLLNAMLNDKNNYIQVKAAKLGCKKFTVQYEPNNFSGVMRITFQPSRQNMLATYQFITNEMLRLDKTMLNEVMIGAAKIQFKKEYNALKKTKDYPKWIVKHWVFNNDAYFPDMCDSVVSIGANRLEKFINNYFTQAPHITGLKISKADRNALKVDSFFTDLDQNVGKYVFTYPENITWIAGNDDNTKLANLLQWLIINPDINIQINGFSDEHEYRKATDEDSIIQFMDSMPTFHKETSELIKHKPSIKPELARPAKIVRYLYEHGIAAERITGTAMMFKSSNKKEADDNRKCTITLNKIHKSPSLFEYHYGKKKE